MYHYTHTHIGVLGLQALLSYAMLCRSSRLATHGSVQCEKTKESADATSLRPAASVLVLIRRARDPRSEAVNRNRVHDDATFVDTVSPCWLFGGVGGR